MADQTIKVSGRYQITIPQHVRQQLNINSGDLLIMDVQDGVLVLIPKPQSYTHEMTGLHADVWANAPHDPDEDTHTHG